jgi:PEP-CTERM motif-containing protein
VTEPGNVPRMRRRRTRRHRRNRLIRRCLAGAAIAIFVVSASGLALRFLSPSLFHADQRSVPTFEQAELSRERLLTLNQLLAEKPPAPDRPVYPYSVVPGGVEDAKELKWVAEHDPVVAAHYAGFDYDHAQVVRLVLAQTAYVSYRIGNHIYWTRHRLKLRKGEKVITDGRIVLRARCANRVEKVPQQASAAVEPPAVTFDQPTGGGLGTALQSPPVPFQSALLNRPVIGSGTGPLSLYDPFGGGTWVPVSPPPLPTELCGPNRKKGPESGGGTTKNHRNPCRPGVVPEPGTWLLFGSGLIAIYWQARRKLARA